MATTTTRRHAGTALRLTPLAGALAAALLCTPALAADWTFTPRVELRTTYSDNVRLAPLGKEVADVIHEVKPGFRLRGDGKRIKLNADYTADIVSYRDNSERNDVLHQFYGDIAAEVIDDWLYFEGNGMAGQQQIDPFGPAVDLARPITTSDNIAEIRTYSASPYIRHDFSNVVTTEVRYAREGYSSSSDLLSDTTTTRKSAVLTGGRMFTNFGWGMLYYDETTDYASSGTIGITTFFSAAKYKLNPTFAITATAGHEKYGYLSLLERSKGNFWTIGFGWRPSPRTILDFSVGR
ncbi:MAG TPA: TIGR03016 family PEP-CTERM system-associated outer membrane protein, partial [Burkholderiaceae bacterium]